VQNVVSGLLGFLKMPKSNLRPYWTGLKGRGTRKFVHISKVGSRRSVSDLKILCIGNFVADLVGWKRKRNGGLRAPNPVHGRGVTSTMRVFST
jgi:hypothetical protein